MSRNYSYGYWFEFENPEMAFDVASGFHESLRGEQDYIDCNIVLSFEGPCVEVSVYKDTERDIRIVDDGFGPYIEYRS